MLIIHNQFRTALVGIRYGIVPWFQSPVIFLLHILIALLYSKHRIGELALKEQGSYVLCRCMNIYEAHMSLTFNKSSVTHRLEHSDVTKIREWVSFYMYFYMGQPPGSFPLLLWEEPGYKAKLNQVGIHSRVRSNDSNCRGPEFTHRHAA